MDITQTTKTYCQVNFFHLPFAPHFAFYLSIFFPPILYLFGQIFPRNPHFPGERREGPSQSNNYSFPCALPQSPTLYLPTASSGLCAAHRASDPPSFPTSEPHTPVGPEGAPPEGRGPVPGSGHSPSRPRRLAPAEAPHPPHRLSLTPIFPIRFILSSFPTCFPLCPLYSRRGLFPGSVCFALDQCSPAEMRGSKGFTKQIKGNRSVGSVISRFSPSSTLRRKRPTNLIE